MRPWLFRPACVGRDSSSVFSGVSVVISSKPEIVMKRRPGLVGLNFLTGIYETLPNRPSILHPTKSSISRGPRNPVRGSFLNTSKQPFDLLALAQSHDRLFPVCGPADLARADAAEAAALLPSHRDGVDVLDLDALRLVLLLERL